DISSLSNSKVTTTKLADGTVATLIEYPDGSRSATISTPDGRQADVPLDLLNENALSSFSTLLKGVEVEAEKGLPILTQEASEHVRVGAKYGGPAFAVAGALWDVAVAETGFERCVAAAEGTTSVTLAALGGIATAGAGPGLAIPTAILTSAGGKALGNWMGNMFCPR
ncbi:MAG: hypothetical protein K0U84_00745, partial [Actinomycetia bacterium]|nr:hypothetical protein [Actinomycetes bacterium]